MEYTQKWVYEGVYMGYMHQWVCEGCVYGIHAKVGVCGSVYGYTQQWCVRGYSMGYMHQWVCEGRQYGGTCNSGWMHMSTDPRDVTCHIHVLFQTLFFKPESLTEPGNH